MNEHFSCGRPRRSRVKAPSLTPSTLCEFERDQAIALGNVFLPGRDGVFVELEPGIEGLIPLSESGVGRDGDVKKAFPIGNTIDVVLLDIDTNLRRIRLSVTAVQKMREADEVREYTERGDAKPAEGFGSMADKLRDALRGGGS